MASTIETVIIGGGQAGLAVSYLLQQRGREHIVLEKAAQAGSAWRNERWDSFTLVTPNWAFLLPGAEYAGDQPDGFMPRVEIVRAFERYVEVKRLPVEFGVQASAVEPGDSGWEVKTSRGVLRAKNVVVATGMFQRPKIPAFASGLPAELLQLPSGRYRNPGALPPGAVLLVGSAQSGCQIAEELYQAGREVYLCTGKAGRVPRRYRGRDIVDWLSLTGFIRRTPAQLPSPQARFGPNPAASGKNGGHTLNLHTFARDGVKLLGRLRDARDGKIYLAADLMDNLSFADEAEKTIIRMIDQHISTNRLDAPTETLPALTDGYACPVETEINLKTAGITTVIWALGHAFDFSLVKLPVFDDAGFPVTHGGVTEAAGLYFAGLPWLPGQASGLLLGVGKQAEGVAEHIAGR